MTVPSRFTALGGLELHLLGGERVADDVAGDAFQIAAVHELVHNLGDDGAQKAVPGLIAFLVDRLKGVEMPDEALPEWRCLGLSGTINLRYHVPQRTEGGVSNGGIPPEKVWRKMSAQNRPQHYRIRRMVQMVRESTETGYLANSRDFMKEFEVSHRTVARDLDYLRDEENTPLAYDEVRHGYMLTDETYALPPVNISRKEAFSFGLARKLLAHYEGTPLHLDMRAVLDKIAESLEGEVTLEPDWLSDHVDVLPEDRVRMAGFIERREIIHARYQAFDGRKSKYRLHPYHLLAYHGNWYLLVHNEEKDRIEEKLRNGLTRQNGIEEVSTSSSSGQAAEP
ncbi:MAG: WYL domain-containing protein [Kiritimatiellae bacterium]|jgi:hypothetical protein|nr:WYL domain-containing protein [Kiritimatiellia bacterium]